MSSIGFILSRGGASCFEALKLSEVDKKNVHIICDRECEALHTAKELGYSSELIEFDNQLQFSLSAKQSFISHECSAVLLLYTRLVAAELYENISTFNIHPSLLPAFKGFNAIEQALKSKVKYQGATLHLVDENPDGGEIISQTMFPIDDTWNIRARQRLSYIQKTMLISLFLETYFGRSVSDEKPLSVKPHRFFISPQFVNIKQAQYFENLLNDLF